MQRASSICKSLNIHESVLNESANVEIGAARTSMIDRCLFQLQDSYQIHGEINTFFMGLIPLPNREYIEQKQQQQHQ